MTKEFRTKTALLTRFGGAGDLAPVTVVGAQLRKRGYHVTLACRFDGPQMRQSDFFTANNDAFDLVLDYKQMPGQGRRCIKTQLGWVSINSIYKNYDLVIDFYGVIEGNSTSPFWSNKPWDSWQTSRSSNWINWYDLHLAWAGIDPTSVPDDEKRPLYALTEAEKATFSVIRKKYSHIFTVQTAASSLSRTWFGGEKLCDALLAKYPDCAVLYWDAQKNVWMARNKEETSILDLGNISPLRLSMGLIAVSDVFIGADTGFTHVAEGLGINHVALYSTVPAWTRAKYYKHQFPIDHGVTNPEYYTFCLGLGDPLRIKDGEDSLSDREKLVATLYERKLNIKQAAEELGCSEEGAEMELKALMLKRESFSRLQSKALASISVQEVMDKIDEALNAKN